MWVRIPAWPVAALVSLSKTLNHNCFILRMGRNAVGPVCCVMHVKEPRTLIVKEKGLAPVFLDSHLEHPAGWICARNKSSVLLLYYYYPKLAQIHQHVVQRQRKHLLFLFEFLFLLILSSCSLVLFFHFFNCIVTWQHQRPYHVEGGRIVMMSQWRHQSSNHTCISWTITDNFTIFASS